jgi:hypothetical protein
MELFLVKYTKILAHTFKWYRHLRKQVKSKQQLLHSSTLARTTPVPSGTDTAVASPSSSSFTAAMSSLTSAQKSIPTNSSSRRKVNQSMRRTSAMRLRNDGTIDEENDNSKSSSRGGGNYVPVSEIAMTKEFLVNGKLHKAVTFGLDIPSLLYSDTNGRGCGIPYKFEEKSMDGRTTKTHIRVMDRSDPHNSITCDDDVLAARLYETNILAECELDYNRVVGQR